MKIAGVMTGTSCDGLDVSCLEFSKGEAKTLWSKSSNYPSGLRQRVLAAQLPNASVSLKQWGALNRDLGAWMARTLAKLPPADVIACHGQTVAHFPAARKLGFTIQLGDPARIAEATGATVISNFRAGDMAAGGEGAPLAPRFHRWIAPQKNIAIHNLGGISNLTYLGAETIAFDTGPGNVWIDAAAQLVSGQKMDRDGKLAARGQPDLRAVDRILSMDYFHKPPPKSTGRDDFPFSTLLDATRQRNEDLVMTATLITSQSILRAYNQFVYSVRNPIRAIYFCGGGARNSFLMTLLKREFMGIHIGTVEELGIDSRYLEAQAFAYFGYLALRGEALGGRWTGVEGWAPPAQITPGANWSKIVRTLNDASGPMAWSPASKARR